MRDKETKPLGRWELLKQKSDFHFDRFRDEPPPFRIIGRFGGADWMPELEKLASLANGGRPYNFYFKVYDGTSHTTPHDRADLESAGYKKTDFYVNKIGRPNLTKANAPNLFKMIEWFELARPITASVHIQRPGQVFPFHIDLFSYHRGPELAHDEMDKHPERWARFTVQLRDWEWGHMWGVGNATWKQWHAGDIMWHPWHNLPHGTANCGHSERISLQITGPVTDATLRKLSLEGVAIDLSSLPPAQLEEVDG
jgi:hypothetical protein